MSERLTRAQRSAANKQRHHAERQAELMARGPAGVAAAWIDRARAIARMHEAKTGDGAAWDDLSRALAAWCDRYGQ